METKTINEIAIIKSNDIIIKDAESAIDFIMTIKYETNCNKIALNKEAVIEDFFILSKDICISIILVIIMLIIAGIITNYIDSGRVTTGHEPQYSIKIVNNNGTKITYWGLGYKVIRYTKISPNEPYENNIGVKMGNWFMKYDLPKEKNIIIEYENKTIKITNHNDIDKISNILENSKYNAPICDGINTHKISIDNEIYYLKESCKQIQKKDKQSAITQEDLNTILEIIDKGKIYE